MSPARGTRVVGYVRVSTEEQSASCEAQRQRIEQYCELYGLELLEVIVDQGASGRTLNRPGLLRALEVLASGQATGIVVAKLDRLTRSVRDLGALLEEVEHAGWTLCSVADQIDTRTASGRLTLNILTSVAQWEREAIGERTRAALAVKRAQGVRLGRPPANDTPEAVQRIRVLRADGVSIAAIADRLNAEGLTTATGRRWHATTVQRVLARITPTVA